MKDGSAIAEPVPVATGTSSAQRWLARLAFLTAAAAVVVLLAAAGLRGSIALILVGTAGVAVGLAAVWWFLSHRGPVRWLAAALAVAAPLAVLVMYARAGLVWVVVVSAALWLAAAAAGRAALVRTGEFHVHTSTRHRRHGGHT